MQILSTYSKSLISPQPTVLSNNSLNQNQKKTQTKLSMLWVNEFDGKRNRLVARWIKE